MSSQPDLPQYLSLPKLSDAGRGKVHLVYEGGIGTAGHRNFLALYSWNWLKRAFMVHIYPSHFNRELGQRCLRLAA
jgi:hypothetical protein